MQYTTILLAALTAVSTGVSGLALPSIFSRDTPCIEELPQYQQAQANQSTVFGLQLAGSAKDQDELDDTCSKLNNGGYKKWSQEGLLIDDVKKPICNARSTTPNATLTLPLLSQANTKLFTTLLLHAFSPANSTSPPTEALSYLCTNLRYIQVDAFLLNSASIIATLCKTSTTPQAPQPFSAIGSINETAIQNSRVASAKLFAYTLASGYTTAGDLERACAQAPERKAAWETLLMDADVVEETLCGIEGVLGVEEAAGKVTEWRSRGFATVLGNVSNAPGFKKEVCGWLSCGGLEGVGVDGEVVRGLICS